MSEPSGAAVVIIGGGVTGLSAGWWLARAGVDVLVLERGIVGWEASGRNGGGATHVYSPFGLEEQRLWPQMDDLLGYPTEYQPRRIGVQVDAREPDKRGHHEARHEQSGAARDAGAKPDHERQRQPRVQHRVRRVRAGEA